MSGRISVRMLGFASPNLAWRALGLFHATGSLRPSSAGSFSSLLFFGILWGFSRSTNATRFDRNNVLPVVSSSQGNASSTWLALRPCNLVVLHKHTYTYTHITAIICHGKMLPQQCACRSWRQRCMYLLKFHECQRDVKKALQAPPRTKDVQCFKGVEYKRVKKFM